jgi:beta-lactamase class A
MGKKQIARLAWFLALGIASSLAFFVGRISAPDSAGGSDAGTAREAFSLPLRPTSDTTGTERGSLEINRLTSPWLECAGQLNADFKLGEARGEAEAFITDRQLRDPTLRISVYARDLNNGPWIGIDERELFAPASLSKVPVMLFVLAEAEKDPTLLNRRLVYPGPDGMEGSDNMENAPEEWRMVPGQAYDYQDLLFRMIALSDNHARDLLRQGIPERDLLGLMATIHAEEVQVGDRRLISPKSFNTFFRVLYNSTLLSRSMSEYALAILAQSYFMDGLRKYIPEDIPIASKFGFHTGFTDGAPDTQFHECGIVYQPGSPFTLCVMTRSAQSTPDELVEMVAQLSHIIWRRTSGN